MKNEIERHEVYKKLCEHVYHVGEKQSPKEAIPLYIHENKKNGFYGCAYKYDDRIIVVFRGTNFPKSNDLKTDGLMGFGRIPDQTRDAILFTKQIQKMMKLKYPTYKLDITGYSLGGSLTQYVHVLVGGINQSVAFLPFGTKNTLNEYLSKYSAKNSLSNLINYCVEKDTVSGSLSKTTQIGKCYYIDITQEAKQSSVLDKYHKINNLRPLSTRIDKNNRMTSISTSCVGSYPVSSYTRSDDTKVSGYTRTCGTKHLSMSMEKRRAGQEKYKGKRFQDIPSDELETAISYFV